MDREHKIRLMLIEKDGEQHYCLVKNVSRLLSSQVSKHKEKSYFCDRCLNPFWCEQSLNKHLEYCSNHEAVKIEMPKKGDILKFKNYYKGEKVPFMIYADTVSLINHCKLVNQVLKVVLLKNIKSMSELVFPIILSALMIMYLNQD